MTNGRRRDAVFVESAGRPVVGEERPSRVDDNFLRRKKARAPRFRPFVCARAQWWSCRKINVITETRVITGYDDTTDRAIVHLVITQPSPSRYTHTHTHRPALTVFQLRRFTFSLPNYVRSSSAHCRRQFGGGRPFLVINSFTRIANNVSFEYATITPVRPSVTGDPRTGYLPRLPFPVAFFFRHSRLPRIAFRRFSTRPSTRDFPDEILDVPGKSGTRAPPTLCDG